MPESHCPNPSGPCPDAASEHAGKLPWKIAGPSFVVPGTVGKNCALLQGMVDEVSLILFETEACLAYDETDLPPDLPGLGLTFHLHLPLDTDWSRGLDHAWRSLDGLLDKTAFLNPGRFVLHPPPDNLLAPLAERFRQRGVDPGRVLLENVRGHDLTGSWDLIRALGYGVCLDLGHVQAYSQHSLLLAPGLWGRVGMIHAHAPACTNGWDDRHLGLDHLDDQGRDLLRLALTSLDRDAVLTLEVFDLEGLARSLKLVRQWWGEWWKQWRTSP